MFSFSVTPHITVTSLISSHDIIQNLACVASNFPRSIGNAIPLFNKSSVKSILANLFGGIVQFPFPVFVTRLLPECFEAMKYIFGWRDPFEIVCPIIMLVSINMINLCFPFGILNKRLGYKPMNRRLDNFPVRLQIHFHIPMAFGNRFKRFYRFFRKFGTNFTKLIYFIVSIKPIDFFPHRGYLQHE